MNELLWQYHRPEPGTWVYLSSFLTLGLFFVFHRFWSVRNLDIVLLVLLGPGFLLIYQGRQEAQLNPLSTQVAVDLPEGGSESLPADTLRFHYLEKWGFIWLFIVGCLFLIRLLMDPIMVRRPLLDPNLTIGGLGFLGGSLLIFMMVNVITGHPREDKQSVGIRAATYPLLSIFPNLDTVPKKREAAAVAPYYENDSARDLAKRRLLIARGLGVVTNVLLLLGIFLTGLRHFNNVKAGLGTALLYLLSPYAAQMTGHLDHLIPGLFLIWAVVMYRQPFISGVLLGAAGGLAYFPLFLLPLWGSFYRQRGFRSFICGCVVALAFLVGCLFLGETSLVWTRIRQMFGLHLPSFVGLQGVWGMGWAPFYRIPMLTGLLILSMSLALWPPQKNLGTLLSCSAAIMVGAQLCHGFGGGLFVAWYLPLLLLTIFRPNLEDRIALKVLGGSNRGRGEVIGRPSTEAA